jgi:hypothetical protein
LALELQSKSDIDGDQTDDSINELADEVKSPKKKSPKVKNGTKKAAPKSSLLKKSLKAGSTDPRVAGLLTKMLAQKKLKTSKLVKKEKNVSELQSLLSETEALDDQESEEDDQISGLIGKIEQKKKSLKAIIAKPKIPTKKIAKKMTKQVLGFNVINETGEANISSVLNKIKATNHYRSTKSSKGNLAGLKGSDKAQEVEDRKIKDLMNQVKQAKARKEKARKEKVWRAKARREKARKKKV